MDVQDDFLGIDTALKLILVWHLVSTDDFYAKSQFVMLRVGHYLSTLLERRKIMQAIFMHTFTNSLHDLPSFYHC